MYRYPSILIQFLYYLFMVAISMEMRACGICISHILKKFSFCIDVCSMKRDLQTSEINIILFLYSVEYIIPYNICLLLWIVCLIIITHPIQCSFNTNACFDQYTSFKDLVYWKLKISYLILLKLCFLVLMILKILVK